MTDPVARAGERFEHGLNCAQSVLAAFSEQLNIEVDTLLRLVSPFGGGIARRGHVCGAVTGALMVIGLKLGASTPEGKQNTYAMAEEFLRRFEACHHTILCRDLTQCDLTTPQGRQQAAERDIHHAICAGLVRDAAQIAAEMLSTRANLTAT